ncbi:MAG: tRNA (adenosine(37)-N6)-dimethylallyltransferase MiaA [Nitrospira bacterium HGW-Nitrospira-1]|nr:MAG: tRNA (adenosine(37)-N6)-dimethylallyltransferase MiaA [Nitrospira bacterium HGW-Nitrospira-1]
MKKVIVLLGPTGVGKTGASILLAKELDTEIISADSMQIYRGMNIGAAKPTKKELAEVTHHMIDIVEPAESYSAGQYIEAATKIIEGLHKKNMTPVVVGGTGLYIKAMTRGIFGGPSADPGLRDELLSMERNLPGSLYSCLVRMDEEAAGKIQRNDIRRIVRALEVCLKSREKISLLQRKFTRPLPYEFIKIGLTRERKELYRIIDERVEKMFEAGFMQEAEAILRKCPERTAMQAIGYKELAMHIDKEIDKDETIRLIKRNTRRYAKRQFTWFKKEEDIHWIDVTGIFDRAEVFHFIKDTLMRIHPWIFSCNRAKKTDTLDYQASRRLNN